MTTRRSYAGAAATQTITAGLAAAGTSVVISDNVGWPTGSSGPFACVISLGKSDEEKILVQAQSANTLTIQSRGYDGTSARDHASGATIQLCVTAADLDEANAHTSSTAGVHGVAGNVVGDSDSQTLSNKTLDATCSIDPSVLAGVTVQGIDFYLNKTPIMSVGGYGNYDESGNAIHIQHGASFATSVAVLGPVPYWSGWAGWTSYVISGFGVNPLIPGSPEEVLVQFYNASGIINFAGMADNPPPIPVLVAG